MPWALLMSTAAAVLSTCVTLAAALSQENGAAASDPLKAYVGTWVATNPGESTPFLILTLSEAGGVLTGTMSPFTVGGVRDRSIVWRPLPYADTQISDLRISDSSLSFYWIGDPPLHGGHVKFVAEGTEVASIDIPMPQEETSRIFADNPGLSRLSPTIPLRRKGATSSNYEQEVSSHDWGEQSTADLINQSEFQYKLDHGVYADYLTLLHSGQLERTKGFNFTGVLIDLGSETDPFPGHVIRLVVSSDGSSYQVSIEWKASADCGAALSTDQTGVVSESHTGECKTSK